MIKIRGHLDLFSGIGGFSLGIEQAAIQPDWTGFSDIDQKSNKIFKRRFNNAESIGPIEDVSYRSLDGRRIDILTAGFPCQAFSISGKRHGFSDTRGTLFFEIERLLQDYIDNGKPIPCILLENVKGLLNHDDGKTFATIYGILSDLNYNLECQLVNTKWWIPQSRERIYIFGRYNGNPCGRKVLPIYNSSKTTTKLRGQHTNTITARYDAGATGSYVVESKFNAQKLRQIGVIGKDSEASRVYDPKGISRTIKFGGGMGAKTGLYKVGSRIRKLTPKECERLQGFPEGFTEGQSDTERYKQLGNAVSVPVVKAIIEKIYSTK